MAELENFLDEMEGQGFENLGAQETATPMLLIAQALSDVTANGEVPAGHFYNSITGKDYGDNVNVIVCHFQKMWFEWKPNQGGLVGRWQVGELEGVTGDVYTGMKHGENDVIETWLYLVILPDHLEDGYLMFSSTRGNLKYLKGWNTQMRYLKTPSGKPAPLFAAVWNLATGKDKNKAGQTYYSCNKDGKTSIKQMGWTTKELFTGYVSPAREIASQAAALIEDKSSNKMIEDNTTDF